MRRITPKFVGDFNPGAVTLYREDLEAVMAEFVRFTKPSDAAGKQSFVMGPEILVSEDVGRRSRPRFSLVADSLDDVKAEVGERLTRHLMITSARDGSMLFLTFYPVLGIDLRAEGADAELAFARIGAILRTRPRWFNPILRVPPWVYALMGIAATLLFARPVLAWNDVVTWFLGLLTIMAIGQAQWHRGNRCRIYLSFRHELQGETRKHLRDVQARIASAIAGAGAIWLPRGP